MYVCVFACTLYVVSAVLYNFVSLSLCKQNKYIKISCGDQKFSLATEFKD